jgi:hypothetical protein
MMKQRLWALPLILSALMGMSLHAQEATPEPAVGPEIVSRN